MESPFILCGLSRVGRKVLDYLCTAGLPVVVIDHHCAPDDPALAGGRLVRGDYRKPEVLKEAGIDAARGVLVMTADDLVNISTALTVRHLNPEVRIVVRMFNEDLVRRLSQAVPNVFPLSTSALTAPLFALSALTGQALGTIRLPGPQAGDRQLAELVITPASPFLGETISAVARRQNLQVVAHIPARQGARLLHAVVGEDRLAAGDRLVLCGQPAQVACVLDGIDALPAVRWAGWLRRMGRVAWRTLADADLAVKVCTLALVLVILVSTLILHFGVEKYDWDLAFYRTVSLMATAADMRAQDPDAPRWLLVFASVLRIVGAALLASFTAILTHYLLRARLSGALEFRRIPDSGHIVVCGLGSVGFRVVQELMRCGERVVVVEVNRENRFVTTARRLGVPVLIGDATVSGVLQHARAATARAVVATTGEDLLNLQIALLARDLHPHQRVVVHLSDPGLARIVREAASIQLALSVPQLAAPDFVAALFVDRVQTVFLIEGRLLAVADLLLPPHETVLARQSVRAVAIDYELLPIAVFNSQREIQADPLAVQLEAGCRLIVVSELPNLERLLRRERPANNCKLLVTRYPVQVRPWLAGLLKEHNGRGEVSIEEALDHPPFCFRSDLTRGQAAALKGVLEAEGVVAEVQTAGC